MKAFRTPALLATCATFAIAAQPAFAQDEAPQETPVAEAEATPADEPVRDGATIYTPADFARFSPRNAQDILSEIPGFLIQSVDQGRGLGQASSNVLVNGERLTSKTESLGSQLQRIPISSVVRIEIVDGATLDIPGLSGQVANIVTRRTSKLTGQFEYDAQVRLKYADPQLLHGEISLSGETGALQYTVALSNRGYRGGSGGPSFFFDPAGDPLETVLILRKRNSDNPKIAGSLGWDVAPDAKLNLNASYTREYFTAIDDEFAEPMVGQNRARFLGRDLEDYTYELGGDFQFPLGPGSLKLIGLRVENSGTFRSEALVTPLGGTDNPFGDAYRQDTVRRETIGRFEYDWKMWQGDWQFAGEAAFNSLDREAFLGAYDPSSESFGEAPFPGGSGGVNEDRYEASLSHSRPLAPNLSLQVVVGGEFSRLSQTGPGGLTREFWRPKGQAALAWKPMTGLDVSLRVERSVGQLSFGDFLADVDLRDGQDKQGNASLVPPQIWETRLEVTKTLGRWGSTTLRAYYQDIDDRVETIVLPGNVEVRGNVPAASRLGFSTNTTVNLDPAGISGAKVDIFAIYEDTELPDPLTGERRTFSYQRDLGVSVGYRHDIPGTDLAYGFGVDYNRLTPYYRLFEVGRAADGPTYVYVSAEHKNVFGMTASVSVYHLNDGRDFLRRTVYDGPRDTAPVLFSEIRDLEVGPIFSFTLKGNF